MVETEQVQHLTRSCTQLDAGVGVLLTRLGEGGKLDKGPSGMGLRIQDTMRIGPCKASS